ncbi:Phosphoribosylformimino-5-aminoimidazole carboxamide ribotide isomerase [Liberibacter crescens BT-1]|uniref:1-(5-phosphoribosyl)-5-[(5-phosphoribosylamino)methylideneamino] imidazole-4-carboxamide isomerase n=1 Tax=Liberibacter crescens (strain BT-1) TaxID=1215343 RepID=L0EXF2_LIBCB|nr:1-(5-phosphoribosyl)-5-[(5-phosphoribosylamino)methylideneamino]imidazole-4-carboxamide isomerase [Liberibacter crescens]AGA65343.1 Phosphoribosylformimino-5-aminoimidazole carboxamide ribotide isomerase [Liberibacter crescens BT-1]AMC12284.1 1-(5-phosphoribosyl)-5-[(5-phosphoribosylamino)methylideneamino] imidazole-4-carboxamide isomerase [Liberibacter crescens]
MILFPAIDIKDGKCVRLKLGDMEQATEYNPDPVIQAKIFETSGFEWLHLIDLNGAFCGKSVNSNTIKNILESTQNPVQLGGGIRTISQVEYWLDKGVARVILGTTAVNNPEMVYSACKLFPGRVVISIDAKNGKVSTEGWLKNSEIGVLELARRFEDKGVAAIIYTDINRDGMLTGINWDSTFSLAHSISIPVIASGGLSSIEDIHHILQYKDVSLEGVISGRALYDGTINAQEALYLIKEAKRKKHES